MDPLIWIRIHTKMSWILNTDGTGTVKSPNFGTAHNFGTAADNFCEALVGFQ
jgi:hypothetical protein